MTSSQAIPGLLDAANASFKSRQIGEHDIAFKRTPNDRLAAELAALKQTPEFAQELVRIIYGDAIPRDSAFYPPLVALAQYLDFSDTAKEIVGIVWAEAFTRLDAGQVESVLLELTTVGQSFGLILGSLPHLVQRQYLSSKTVMRVSDVVAKHIGNTYGPGLDRALEAFAERQPTEAIKVLSEVTPTDENRGILSILLGRLRICSSAASIGATVTQFEEKFKSSAQLVDRDVFYRSWFQETFSGRLTVDDVVQLCAIAEAKGEADVQLLIGLVAIWMSTPQLSPPVFRRAFEWLEKQVVPTISDVSKLQVAQFASFFNQSQYQWPDAWRPNISPLVVSILPIEAEHLGIWDKLDFYLTSLLPADVPTFQTVMRELASRSGNTWLKVLKKHPGMVQLLNQMYAARQDQLIGEFCLSADRTKRHIGFYFFDKIHGTELPPTTLAACDPRICWILLHEVAVVASGLNKESSGRCLLSLANQADRMGANFTDALKQELLLQAKNYPGALGKMFTEASPCKPILQEVMADQDKYFKALAKTKESSVLQMQVQGYHRAMEEFGRKFSNEIQEGARKHSVLMQMVHEVAILYGLSWSTFQGNQLGEPTNLQRISHGTELPRLELIDPEGMQMRRLHALTQINLLEADIQRSP